MTYQHGWAHEPNPDDSLWPLGVARDACGLVKSALRTMPAVKVAAAVWALLPHGADAGGELLAPADDTSHLFTALLLALCVATSLCSCLCGYLCGRCHNKPIYIDRFVEPPQRVETTKQKESPKQRRTEYLERVWLSPHGECYHVTDKCRGLVGTKATSQRLCGVCVGK